MISAKADKVLGHPVDVRRFSDEMGSAARHTRLGRDNGNRLDYDHINMLTAPQAQEDHFPDILAWLRNPRLPDRQKRVLACPFLLSPGPCWLAGPGWYAKAEQGRFGGIGQFTHAHDTPELLFQLLGLVNGELGDVVQFTRDEAGVRAPVREIPTSTE